MRTSRLEVGVFGFFGTGNIGNEASLAAFLDHVRRRHPDASVRGFVAGPDAVRSEHGIPAVQLMAYRGDRGAGRGEAVLKLLGRAMDVPRLFRLVGEVDVLVVPGTGVLETRLMDRPWGMPYWLFLATLTGRLRRRAVALVCVGAEPAEPLLTRTLFRWTARLATWVSVRDQASHDVLRTWGVDRPVAVSPDLAFALPSARAGSARPGHVVIGVMVFEGGPGDRDRGPAVVDAYVQRMAQVVGRIVEGGGSVTLVVGDLADLPLARDIHAVVVERSPRASSRVDVSQARTLPELVAEYSAAEVAIASRFHNLVAALMAVRPTISLSYAPKSRDLLREFCLEDLVQPVDSFDVDLLLEQVDRCRVEQPDREVSRTATLRRLEREVADLLDDLSRQVLGPAGERSRRGPRRRAVHHPRRR